MDADLWAQGIGGRGRVTAESVWNPKPDPTDFILPLPCGLGMAFRPIFIPEKGYLAEARVFLGADQGDPGDGQTRAFVNSRRDARLGSALALENMPDSYVPLAREAQRSFTNDPEGRQFYLLGKYEVSRGQWEAVMNGNCQLENDSPLPVTDVSWHDAVSFTEKLMIHILAESPESLPSYKEDSLSVATLRLPTEDEWEYAARGGHRVSPESMNSESFFPMESGAPKDYGHFNDGVSPPAEKPQPIGRRAPNPAGLYDTAGNVAEMTQETYRMNIGSRLHGSSGGVILKGGSFRSREPQASPGAREETPFFYRSGPSKLDDMGFRLALSAVNLGSRARLQSLAAEFAKAVRTDAHFASTDPLSLLDELIAQATGEENAREKSSLETLKTVIENFNGFVNEGRKNQLRRRILLLVYQVFGVHTNSLRADVDKNNAAQAELVIAFVKDAMKAEEYQEPKMAARARDLLAQAEERVTYYEGQVRLYEESNRDQHAEYVTLLKDLTADFSAELISERLLDFEDTLARLSPGEANYYASELVDCFAVVRAHLNMALVEKKDPASFPLDDLRPKNSYAEPKIYF
jgi:hypothetical protein